jgi:hypothetical protein
MKANRTEMWECPRCGRSFINTNQHHGCMLFDIERHFVDKDTFARPTFERVCEVLNACGDYTILGQKTWIAFQGRSLFAFLKPKRIGVEATVVLELPIASPRIVKQESFSSRKEMYRIILRSMDDLDDEFLGWLSDAYSAGW